MYTIPAFPKHKLLMLISSPEPHDNDKLQPVIYMDTFTEQNKEAHPEQACLVTTKHTFWCCTWAAIAVRSILTAETALLAVEGGKMKKKIIK